MAACVGLFRGFADMDLYGQTASGEVLAKESVIYKTVPDTSDDGMRPLRFDWIRPADWTAGDQRGSVVFFHGGGWVGGAPGQFSDHAAELAARGLVCFHVEYRLLSRDDQSPPDQCVEDASDAFRRIRRDAGVYGIDPDRIAAGGGSAGGHLAAFLGMMDDEVVGGVSRKPNALLLHNPVYDNGPGGWGTARVKDAYLQYSPRHNLSQDDPPAIVYLGTNDKLIPVATAESFRDESVQLGLRSDLHLYEGRGHGFFNSSKGDGSDYLDTLTKSIAFLESLGWFTDS
ncbi:MAG: alpha/beta hydrolase fold domain-containing protein [Planctomycetota bacterium]